MENLFNLDAIQTELKRRIAENSAFLEAWKKVTFPVKKDGKPFASMQKNIEGAKYTLKSYASQDGEYELTVYTHSNLSGYIHESINCYNIVRYMTDESMKAKTENYMPKCDYLEQVYKYDLEDIKKAAADRITYLEAHVNDLKNQLEASQKVFDNFKSAYASAMKVLEEDTKDFDSPTLFYAVCDCVKNRYPYV